MAENPLLKSPFSIADFELESAPQSPSGNATARRGIAPSRTDLIARAEQLGVDPTLALSFFSQESSGNWNSKDSPKGARGGMQVMPGTYRSMMGTDAGQENPWNNMEAGLRYIAYGQKKLKTSDPELLAAGYHAGYDHPSLRNGVIPNTNDGIISTADYARSVADRIRGRRAPSKTSASVVDLLNQGEPGLFSKESDGAADPVLGALNANDPGAFSMETNAPVGAVANADDGVDESKITDKFFNDQPLWDYLKSKGVRGWEDMEHSLDVAKWAVGGVDDATMAEQLSKKMQKDAGLQWKRTADEVENDAAWKRVSRANGFIDTTKETLKAIGTSLSNPKATLGEIVQQGANSLVSMASGIGGAGTGAAVGGGVGAVAGGVGAVPGAIGGAIIGGRTGMAAGTTVMEGAGQIQEFVANRLEANKQPPTAQNILALISSPEFKAEAIKQGLAKGLTIAAVDQFTMGLGGKIATAPARKIASKELADQGMDMATRAARKEALASPAGQAALKAAKPTMAARVGAGAAAVGVDATGEVVGDYWGSVNADGTGDIGESLRGGVMSVGQSGVSVAVGATIETAKLAAAQAKSAMQPTAKSPSTASGPLARAAENAAAEPERVTVTAPDGEVSGTVTGQTADAVQIVGDDGQVYNFKTGPDGVKITPEAPNTPLSNALEVAATQGESNAGSEIQGDTSGISNAEAESGKSELQESQSSEVILGGQESTTKENANAISNVAQNGDSMLASTPNLQEGRDNAAVSGKPAQTDTKSDALPQGTAFSNLTDDELRARLRYISDQAKTNGGWNKMLVEQRRMVSAEIDKRAPKVEAPKGEQPTLDLKPVEPAKPAAPVAQATPAQQPAASLPKELAGAKPRYNYGNKGFNLAFESDFDKAAFIAAQPTKSKRDADYLAHAMQVSGLSEDEVRAHGAQVREAIKAMAKDGKPGTLKVPEVARGQARIEETPAPAAEPVSQPATTGATSESETTQPPQAAPSKPKTASKEDLEHLFGVDKKRAKALERIEAGKAWFNDGVKAKDFIAKNGLSDTHEVKRGNGGRWDVMAKQPADLAPDTFAGSIKQEIDRREREESQRKERDARKKPTDKTPAQQQPKEAPYRAVQKDGQFVLTNSDDETIGASGGGGERKFKSEGEAYAWAEKNGIEIDKGPTDGNDTSAERKPAGAEAVGEKADAGQAEAAAVQPAAPAKEEVTAEPQAQGAEDAKAEQTPFDSAAWNKERDDRIKASRDAGNIHLDKLPSDVESMRGKEIYNVHDNKERGVIRTVDNRGNVYVNWADQYSAEKNLASPSFEGRKQVFQTSLGRTDLKDYVVDTTAKPKTTLAERRKKAKEAASAPEQSAQEPVPRAAKPAKKPAKQDERRAKLEKHFTPGNIIKSGYWKSHERVLSFDWNDGNWDVTVETVVKKDGQWVATEKPRTHSTAPEKRDEVIERAAPQEATASQAGQDKASAEPAQQVEPAAEQPAQPGRIEDFGQKLGGARKDQSPSLQRDFSDDDLTSLPLSKIWPAAEVDAIEDPFVAAVAAVTRSEIPAKPRQDYKVKRWVEKVKTVRDLAKMVIDGKVSRDELLERLGASRDLNKLRAKLLLLEQIDRSQWSRIGEVDEYPNAEDAQGNKRPIVYVAIDGRSHRFDGQSVADVVDAANAALGQTANKRMQFEVRQNLKTNSVFVNKKGDPERRALKTFANSKEAFAFIKNNYDELAAAWDGVKERDNVKEADTRNAENRPRTGADRRAGKDVTAEQFGQTFGFRGVEFGNWVGQGKNMKERQGMLNEAYDALMDLADIVGVPPKAMSLNGTLGLGFGSRGSGKASAHFEPGNLVINLTKTKGAGALAHEWFHALDNYFSRQRGGEKKIGLGFGAQDAYRNDNYITHKPEPLYVHKTQRSTPISRARLMSIHKKNPGAKYYDPADWQVDPSHPEGVRPEVEAAFADLVAALDASPMAERARSIDKGKEGYWSRTLERAARAFENYVIERMLANGYHNDYLANVKAVEDFPRAKERYPYLLPEEVAPVAEAFDTLFSAVKTREDEAGNVAMFSRAALTATIEVDGKQRPTTNSNGQQIASTEEGVRNFWAWFGDSKVVDAEGKPLVVYHGTRSDVDTFASGLRGQNYGDKSGFFFTNNPSNAGYSYAAGEGGNVMPVYLSLKDPLTLSYDAFNSDKLFFDRRSEIMEQAEAGGYDGVIVEDNAGNKTLVAFRPEQIKSATGNNGEFDARNLDIRFSRREDLIPTFEALDGRGLVRKRALDSLASMPDGEKISYIENNFFDILGELEDNQLVQIKC